MAMPWPLSLPALFLISERDRCPKIIATMESGRNKKKSPDTKLTIAFPLVSAGAAEVGPPSPGEETDAGVLDDTLRPQTRQNCSPAATLFPQAAQNEPMRLLFRVPADHPKICTKHTLRAARRQ